MPSCFSNTRCSSATYGLKLVDPVPIGITVTSAIAILLPPSYNNVPYFLIDIHTASYCNNFHPFFSNKPAPPYPVPYHDQHAGMQYRPLPHPEEALYLAYSDLRSLTYAISPSSRKSPLLSSETVSSFFNSALITFADFTFACRHGETSIRYAPCRIRPRSSSAVPASSSKLLTILPYCIN
ncbi:hypothetical protein D3C77_516650 [compost metagenome]